ncbi:unnamed protein product [Adineta ricciae]|uniref:N-acetyltransferase domain-containing protein n=1 Tax=Adineta ricciae TaxID=249248 RepID=A0A815V3L8_ADIRI|nr:unnamed protein product [Adineta ricciae]CAF1524822.1 unnamed protein product [Adineta ricciae]
MANNSEEYAYEVIDNETDAFICAQLLADEFAKHEPLTSFSQIGSKEFLDQVIWPAMLDSLKHRLSVLARHRLTNEIVATILANDLYFDHKKHPYNPSDPPHSFALIDFASEMDEAFIQRDFGQKLEPYMVLHIFIGTTQKQHSGKGIATRLRAFICDNARKTQGYQYAFVQASNPATYHIYIDKMGGQIVTLFDPKTWVWKKKGDGKSCPFKEFTGGIIPNILIKLT